MFASPSFIATAIATFARAVVAPAPEAAPAPARKPRTTRKAAPLIFISTRTGDPLPVPVFRSTRARKRLPAPILALPAPTIERPAFRPVPIGSHGIAPDSPDYHLVQFGTAMAVWSAADIDSHNAWRAANRVGGSGPKAGSIREPSCRKPWMAEMQTLKFSACGRMLQASLRRNM